MHASQDIRNVKCFDGLQYSFEMLCHSYNHLYESCTAINKDNRKLIPALTLCWSFIDSLHRIREISQAIPGLSKNNNELKLFLKKTNITTIYRNYIQHLRKELSNKEISKFPVWGSLSWVDADDSSFSHILIFGTQIQGTQYSGCVYDTHKNKWVSKVCLSVEGLAFNYDSIYQDTTSFMEFLLPWIKSNYKPGIVELKKLPIITVQIQTERGM